MTATQTTMTSDQYKDVRKDLIVAASAGFTFNNIEIDDVIYYVPKEFDRNLQEDPSLAESGPWATLVCVAHINKKTGEAESYVQMYLDAHKAKAEADAAASEQA